MLSGYPSEKDFPPILSYLSCPLFAAAGRPPTPYLMPSKVSFVAITAAAIALASFVTLEYTFGDTFTRSLTSDISEALAILWGGTAPSRISLGMVVIVYFLVGVVGGALGVLAYKILKRILGSLAKNPPAL